MFCEFPHFKKEKKLNSRQDSQETLSEKDLIFHGLFLNNTDMDADNKASMKEIIKILKSPESVMGGKSTNDFNYLNGYGNCDWIHD